MAICEKCGQDFGNHNDDGSCVDDADLEDDEYEIRQATKKFEADLAHADFLYHQMKEG